MSYRGEMIRNWAIDVEEISPYNFKVTAVARDGRRIEATGSDENRLRADVLASIRDSDEQIGGHQLVLFCDSRSRRSRFIEVHT